MLKRFINIAFCFLAIFTLFAITALAAEDTAISVVLDGEKLEFDVPPQIINDRTMVPMRKIFESLGATVEWDGESQTVTAIKDETQVIMRIDDAIMFVNGKEIIIDTPPCLVGGRTLVPVRAVAEGLGTEVVWDSNARTVIITSKPVPPITSSLSVTLNGQNIEWMKGAEPYRDGTEIMIPLKKTVEALGGVNQEITVQGQQRIVFTLDNTALLIIIGEKTYAVTGIIEVDGGFTYREPTTYYLSNVPVVKNGDVFIPLSHFCTAFGLEVQSTEASVDFIK